jgi:hypothetical protein
LNYVEKKLPLYPPNWEHVLDFAMHVCKDQISILWFYRVIRKLLRRNFHCVIKMDLDALADLLSIIDPASRSEFCDSFFRDMEISGELANSIQLFLSEPRWPYTPRLCPCNGTNKFCFCLGRPSRVSIDAFGKLEHSLENLPLAPCFHANSAVSAMLNSNKNWLLKDCNVKDEPAADDEDRACVVCLDAKARSALIPCGHKCLCIGCTQKLCSGTDTCPKCRAPIDSAIVIYE